MTHPNMFFDDAFFYNTPILEDFGKDEKKLGNFKFG